MYGLDLEIKFRIYVDKVDTDRINESVRCQV